MDRLILIWVSLLAAGLLIGCDREKKAAPVGANPTKPIEVSLGSVNTGNGLRSLISPDGRAALANVGGSDCRSSKSGVGGHAYCYFAIDPKIKSTEGGFKNGKVRV